MILTMRETQDGIEPQRIRPTVLTDEQDTASRLHEDHTYEAGRDD